MLGPFATASRLTPTHQVSLPLLSRAACASISTTTTTTRDRDDRYGPMEWAQQKHKIQWKMWTTQKISIQARLTMEPAGVSVPPNPPRRNMSKMLPLVLLATWFVVWKYNSTRMSTKPMSKRKFEPYNLAGSPAELFLTLFRQYRPTS